MSSNSDQNRLEELQLRIKKAQQAADPRARVKDDMQVVRTRRAIKMIRVGSDFVAVVVLFGCGGWFLDSQLGSQPWLMIAGLVLGFAAGFWMLARLLFRKTPTSEE